MLCVIAPVFTTIFVDDVFFFLFALETCSISWHHVHKIQMTQRRLQHNPICFFRCNIPTTMFSHRHVCEWSSWLFCYGG